MVWSKLAQAALLVILHRFRSVIALIDVGLHIFSCLRDYCPCLGEAEQEGLMVGIVGLQGELYAL